MAQKRELTSTQLNWLDPRIIYRCNKIQVILGKKLFQTDPAQNGKEYIINGSPWQKNFFERYTQNTRFLLHAGKTFWL